MEMDIEQVRSIAAGLSIKGLKKMEKEGYVRQELFSELVTIVHFINNIHLFIFSQLLTFTAANGLFVALRLLFHRVKGGDTICLEHPCGEAPVVLVKQNNQ